MNVKNPNANRVLAKAKARLRSDFFAVKDKKIHCYI